KTLDESGGLLVTSDMWIAPKIAAMSEIAEFELRYVRKLEGPMVAGASPEQLAAALALYPGLKDAIARMRAEGVKMDGTAIQTTTKIEAVKSPEDMERERQQKEQESRNAAGSVGGLLGGFAKKKAQKKEGGEAEQGSHATVMTLTGEVLKVTTAVMPADVAVPAGFTAR